MLPGGICRNGTVETSYRFKAVDGALELAIAEANAHGDSVPEQVTAVLTAALSRLGGQVVDEQTVAELCVADRQYLMRRLAEHFGLGDQWFSQQCSHCGEPFDFQLNPMDLPVKPKGQGYPEAQLDVAGHSIRFRVPNGEDQVLMSELQAGANAAAMAAQLCLTPDQLPNPLSDAQLTEIESAIEAVAPEVADSVQLDCPECGQLNEVLISPYRLLSRDFSRVFHEVHTLAWHYHWSEGEIMAMPQQRRQLYLKLIDRTRGVHS